MLSEEIELNTFANSHSVLDKFTVPGSRRLLKSQRSRAKQLVAMNVASGDDLLIE